MNYQQTSNTGSLNSAAATFSDKWTKLVHRIHKPIVAGLRKITEQSARRPKTIIACVLFLSILLLVIGIFTGFTLVVDEDSLWTPTGSKPIQHSDWIDNESGFPMKPRIFNILFHENGSKHILGQHQVNRIFEAVGAVQNLSDYPSVCDRADNGDCTISGVTNFWNNSQAIFHELVKSDDEAIVHMSNPTYPIDGTPVVLTDIFGNPFRDTSTNLLTEAQSYIVSISLPKDQNDESISQDFEKKALDVILDLDEQWKSETGNTMRVEVIAERSFPDEFERAVLADIPLIPIVFVLMGCFTSLIFTKRDNIKSRSLLGFMAVVSVLLSIMAGYGLLFVCFIPFTSMTQILPFVLFGVGLDDAFIITGSFFRTDPEQPTEERVAETIDDIGVSIFLTTLTSALAFGIGCTSDIPAVYYLCLYAVPTIVLILLWQLTFFISCLVLDERRVLASNRDCLRCLSCNKAESNEPFGEPQVSRSDQWMVVYAQMLLIPWVKVVVIISFIGITVAAGMSASSLKQSFKFTEVLPDESYITDFFNAVSDYTSRSTLIPQAYFRFVDQSDSSIQAQMEEFVNDLVGIDAIVDQPTLFWLRDFKKFIEEEVSVADMEFNSQVDAFLSNPIYQTLYSDHIVRNSSGTVTASRVSIPMDNVDLDSVREKIDALEDQQDVTANQSINQGQSNFRFFTFEVTYNAWEFYAASANEIVFTTVSGVCAVTAVAFFLVPHWSAVFFVFPLICILYVDLLGVLQWAGISINPVSYITLVMSIGLLVDFIMHILLRYYESPGSNRSEKVVDMMRTMGSSIVLGAVTTFLGTVPLAFSTSEIFSTVFIAFLGLVVIGATHGLILLPVLLTICGPEEHIPYRKDGLAPMNVIALDTCSLPLEESLDGNKDNGKDGTSASGMCDEMSV